MNQSSFALRMERFRSTLASKLFWQQNGSFRQNGMNQLIQEGSYKQTFSLMPSFSLNTFQCRYARVGHRGHFALESRICLGD
jgi:hypothetical protein